MQFLIFQWLILWGDCEFPFCAMQCFLHWIGCSGKPALNQFSGELVPLDRLQPAYSIKPATCTQRQHLQFEDNPSCGLSYVDASSIIPLSIIWALLHLNDQWSRYLYFLETSVKQSFGLKRGWSWFLLFSVIRRMAGEEKVGEMAGRGWVPGVMFVRTLWQNKQKL